jgi:CheY-like chemotaxis protein
VDILKVALVNLPSDLHSSLTVLIKEEQLGVYKNITTRNSLDFFNNNNDDANFIIIYDATITEDRLCELPVPLNIPVILLTHKFNFEMERTARSCNIDLIIDIDTPDVIALIYGFVNQYYIYQSQHALIVDDSRVDSCIVSKNLSKEFIKNTIELNPDNVIEVLKTTVNITLVILDYEMPNKNGCQLMQEIKSTFPERHFIFIGITASRNAAIKFLYDAADDVFTKPLDLEMFSVTLRKLIFNSYQTAKARQSLIDYKDIMNSLAKDIYNPFYIMSTINDVLLDQAPKTPKIIDATELCRKSKDNIHSTFTALQSYLSLSQYLHDPLLKACSLNSMIAGQLYVEAGRNKIKNIIIKEQLDDTIKSLCVPGQVEQVITYLTQSALHHSVEGGQIDIRLYPEKLNIVFEVEDSSACSLTNSSTCYLKDDATLEAFESTSSLNVILSKKIIESLGGSMGKKQGRNGMVYYFKLPSYSLSSDNLH